MRKKYVLDTNVLIQSPDAILCFEENEVKMCIRDRFVERFRKTAEEDGQDLEKFRHLFGESDDEGVYCYSPNLIRN